MNNVYCQSRLFNGVIRFRNDSPYFVVVDFIINRKFFFWLGEVARFSTKFSHCLIWMENIDHDNSRIYSTCTQWQYSDLQSNKAWNWFSHCHRNWFIILSIRSAFIAFHESTWNFVYLFSQRQFNVFRRLTADNISSMESV